MIDIVLAIESVMTAAGLEAPPAHSQPGRPDGTSSLTERALELAMPEMRPPGAAEAGLALLRRDPRAAVDAWGCTLGAVLVWRAVDRAEQDGASRLAAAEASLNSASAYADLLPDRLVQAVPR